MSSAELLVGLNVEMDVKCPHQDYITVILHRNSTILVKSLTPLPLQES